MISKYHQPAINEVLTRVAKMLSQQVMLQTERTQDNQKLCLG